MTKVIELERKRKQDSDEGMIQRLEKIIEPGEKILEGEKERILCRNDIVMILMAKRVLDQVYKRIKLDGMAED